MRSVSGVHSAVTPADAGEPVAVVAVLEVAVEVIGAASYAAFAILRPADIVCAARPRPASVRAAPRACPLRDVWTAEPQPEQMHNVMATSTDKIRVTVWHEFRHEKKNPKVAELY